mmetsp:Transcript_20204/g.50998  ORF Transcript_20204/g.50998 Transcript_20204/m.50998 type:complete len:467 (+) Transcript_20204:83-1483(+)
MPQPPPADLDLKELRKLHSCLSKAELDLTESRPGEMVAKLGQLVAQTDRLAQVHGWKFVYPAERSSMCGGGPRVVQMKPTEQRTYAIFNNGKGQTPSSSSRADIDLNRFNVSYPARSPLHHHDLTHSTSNSRGRDRSASIEQVPHQVPLNSTTAAKQQEPLMSTQAGVMKSVEELKAKVTKLWDGVAQDQLVVRKKFSELDERLDQRLAACEQQLAKTKEKVQVEVDDGTKYDGSTSAASDWNNYNGGTGQHHYTPSSWGRNWNSNSNQEQGNKTDKNWWDKIEEQLHELDSKVEETKKENKNDGWQLGKRLEEVERENETLRGDNAALRARVEGLGEKIGGMASTLEKLLALEHRESRKRKIKEIGEELLGLQQQSAEEEEKQAAKMKRKMLGLADADCGAAPFLGSAEAASKLTTCSETARAHSKGTASSTDRPDERCFFDKVCSGENFPSLPLPPESRGPLYQ